MEAPAQVDQHFSINIVEGCIVGVNARGPPPVIRWQRAFPMVLETNRARACGARIIKRAKRNRFCRATGRRRLRGGGLPALVATGRLHSSNGPPASGVTSQAKTATLNPLFINSYFVFFVLSGFTAGLKSPALPLRLGAVLSNLLN